MKKKVCKGIDKNSGSGFAFCFVGFVGAAVYYLQQATTIGEGILGILKAMVWPAFLIHKLLGFLEM